MTLDIDLRGHKITAFPERCAFWHEKKTLILSDVHWGKSETLQKAGIPLPSGNLERELALIEVLVERTQARRIMILGDLIHGRMGLTPAVVDVVASWRKSQSMSHVEMVLVKGNHDQHLALPDAWHIEEVSGDITEDQFVFRHAPTTRHSNEHPLHFEWAGHVHPVIKLGRRWESLRMPCFVIGSHSALLPAFGLTTGGYAVVRKFGERILAVADDRVIEV